jgi:hypothetical protein
MLSKRASGNILKSRRWRVSRAAVRSSSISASSNRGGTQILVISSSVRKKDYELWKGIIFLEVVCRIAIQSVSDKFAEGKNCPCHASGSNNNTVPSVSFLWVYQQLQP